MTGRSHRTSRRLFLEFAVSALVAIGMMGCDTPQEDIGAVSLQQVKADLETLKSARIFFGHQSVGRNILDGIRNLSAEVGVSLPIVEVTGRGAIADGPGLFHANVGRNGAPDTKLRDFVTAVASSAGYDLAVLKFCYVDLEEEGGQQPQELFDGYRSVVASLQTQQPGLVLVHATMPLTADPAGWKTAIKRLIGRPTWSDAANRRRGDYNRLLRAEFKGAGTFDVARLESIRRDGSVSAFSMDQQVVESMAPEHTSDGGHLNEEAKRRVAAGFLRALALNASGPSASEAAPGRAHDQAASKDSRP